MKLSPLAKAEWIIALLTGGMLTFGVIALGWWWLALITIPIMVFAVTFFRDPDRLPPTQRGVVIAPADGRVVSVHDVKQFEPFGEETAVCIRIFLSVFNVHVQRTPCHGRVQSITHKPGKHISVLNPASVEQNESVLMVLQHPVKDRPIAAVRQIAGSFARTIVCAAKEGEVLQRAQRFGLIKLGSTVELYLPKDAVTRISVGKGQKTVAGVTVLAEVTQTAMSGTTSTDDSKPNENIQAPTASSSNEETESSDLRWEETADAESQPTPEEAESVEITEDFAPKTEHEPASTQPSSTSIESDTDAPTPQLKQSEDDPEEAASDVTDIEYADENTDEDEEAWEYEEADSSDDEGTLEDEQTDDDTEYIYVDEDGNEIVDEEVEEDFELESDDSDKEQEEVDDAEQEEEEEEEEASTSPTASLSSSKATQETTKPVDASAKKSNQDRGKSHGPLFADTEDTHRSTKKRK